MPKADRKRRDNSKSLADAASKPGQCKLTHMFPCSSSREGTVETAETESDQRKEVRPSESKSTEILSADIGEVWIQKYEDFSEQDRKESERNGRFFNKDWFKKYDWLFYNRNRKKSFCTVCTSSSKRNGNFNFNFGGEGFDNWKKGLEKFKEHEESALHKAAISEEERGKRTIAESMSTINYDKQQLRLQGLISHLQTLKTLLRQGVAIRGDLDSESNIYQFDLDKARNDKGLEILLKEKHYVTAHDILDEQKQMLVINARRNLLQKISNCDFYSILADESSDVSKKEQLSFSVRTCNDDYVISEDFIGIFECAEGISSDSLLLYTKDVLRRCCLNGSKMAAMGFDGAAAMKCLAKKITTDIAPNAIYIHCFAHCNELVVQDAVKQSKLLSSSLDLCQTLYAVVGAYPKRILLFEKIQDDFKQEKESDDYCILRLQSLSTTRWTTRVKAADVVFTKAAELRETLEMLKCDSSVNADTKARINGILKQLSSCAAMFYLNATRKLIVLLEKFSKELQSVDISADYALFSLKLILQRLQEMREEEFDSILEEAKRVSNVGKDTSDMAEPRQRKIPRWMETGESIPTDRLPTTWSTTSNAEMRRAYFQAIDVIVSSITDRFEQRDLSLLKSIEQILFQSIKQRGVSPSSLTNDLINKDKLATNLDDLPTILGLYNVQHKQKVKEVSRISTIAEIFNAMPSAKHQCSEVHKLLKLYYTVPLSSASCERSFSAMRRLKTWIRARSGGNHLNDIMFAHIQKKDMDEVDVKEVAKEFVRKNEKRTAFFGHVG